MMIGVIGSRTFNDYKLLSKVLDLYKNFDYIIVSGGANGADSLSEKYAKENNIKTNIYLPDWKKYGKSAGFIRNNDIVNNSDIIIAFWDGKSKGTKHSISLAKKQNKNVSVYYRSKNENRKK